MSTILGLSFGAHDAGTAVISDGHILFATNNERYTRVKNDARFSRDAVDAALSHVDRVDAVAFYERGWRTQVRRVRAGQVNRPGRVTGWRAVVRQHPRLRRVPLLSVGHHEAHAAGGFFTSGFSDALVVVVDAIGEWDTITVWHAEGERLRRLAVIRYPHSIGLLYSAFTDRIGFRPNEEEYILMGLSSFADTSLADVIWRDFVERADWPHFRLRTNPHRGVRSWRPDLENRAAVAAGIQEVTVRLLDGLFDWARSLTPSRRLVFSGGVALNCVYNDHLARRGWFDDIWIMPNPGDAGSSLGAALAVDGRHAQWLSPLLGHDLGDRADLEATVKLLQRGEPVAFAQGRAEFGPRALGSRSLLADPRTLASKSRVNAVKKRQAYRPFAPAVLSGHAADHFDLPARETPYMQYAVPCLTPRDLLSVCHVDGTSRVQTVSAKDNPGFHELLLRWYDATGCPVLLNTSLNIRGEPLVNSVADLRAFTGRYGVEAPGA